MKLSYYGDPLLATDVTMNEVHADDTLEKVIDDMFMLMRAKGGASLSANQVGLPYPIFVWEKDGDSGVAIHPTIDTQEGSGVPLLHEEGCLSCPGVKVPVKRISHVTLTAEDASGNEYAKEASGFLATIFQHEIDHLRGVQIIDFCNRATRRQLARSFR